jgi:hypothetical protein
VQHYSGVPRDLNSELHFVFAVDYLCGIPLWGSGWELVSLPDGLIEDLKKWQNVFDSSFDPFKDESWSSGEI